MANHESALFYQYKAIDTEISKFPQVGFHWTVYGTSSSSSEPQDLGEARFTFSNSFAGIFSRPLAEVRATVREMVSHLPPAARERYLPHRVLDVAQKLRDLAACLEADGTPTRDLCFAVLYYQCIVDGDQPPSGGSSGGGGDVNYMDREEDEDEEMMESMMWQPMEEVADTGRRSASVEYVQGLGRASGTAMDAAATCTICQEEDLDDGIKKMVKLECSHVFHYECMREWMERNHVCPLYRFAMPREKVDMHRVQLPPLTSTSVMVYNQQQREVAMAGEEGGVVMGMGMDDAVAYLSANFDRHAPSDQDFFNSFPDDFDDTDIS